VFINLHKLVARVRGTDAGNYAENRDTEQFHMDTMGSQELAEGLPSRAELVRLGDSWQVMGAASTGLNVLPTTAGLLQLWNGEPGNGKSYVIDSIAAQKVIIDVTTNDIATVFAQILRPPVAAPTDAALTIRSLNGKYTYGGRARTVATATTIANRWKAIGSIPNTSSAIAGGGWACLDKGVLGAFIIPPGGSIALAASEVTATASTFRFTIRWHEVLQPLVS